MVKKEVRPMHGLQTSLGEAGNSRAGTLDNLSNEAVEGRSAWPAAGGAPHACEVLGNGHIEIRNARAGEKSQRPWPKCAPKVRGAVRAAAYHWQSTSVVSQADAVLSSTFLARRTLARISSAFAVQVNPRGSLLCSAM